MLRHESDWRQAACMLFPSTDGTTLGKTVIDFEFKSMVISVLHFSANQ